ncbi:unnamed protein product [Caenorhabditis bovis]|uniref:C2 domain-containing protein n=1 Tax=Caenorhabditis bovis TaxID=2654633 RepID=A0A8S1EIC9_9PELO|nr:unnamed protein product [Caenorhabditis bovis]
MLHAILMVPLLAEALADTWMKVNIKKIEHKPCSFDKTSWGFETGGCAKMNYMTLDERILLSHERRSTSFEHIDGVLRPTVTYWPHTRLQDWMLSIQFIAVDPSYGIARTCDLSGFVKVFEDYEDGDEIGKLAERDLDIEGQCFVARVNVQASKGICPWCVEEAKPAELLQPSSTTTPDPMASLATSNPFLLIAMVSLTLITVLALFGTGVILICYIAERRPASPNASHPTYELPSPVSKSTLTTSRRKISQSTWTTSTSSENWCELPTERWISYNDQTMEKGFNADVVDDYHVIADGGAKFCVSPDSGCESV